MAPKLTIASHTRLVQPYDLAVIARWRRAQGLPEAPSWWFPGVGYVALAQDGVLLACCFLLQTDTLVAHLEAMHADPDAEPDERRRALDAVACACIEDARMRGYKLAIATTASGSVADCARRLGGRVTSEVAHIISFDLEETGT